MKIKGVLALSLSLLIIIFTFAACAAEQSDANIHTVDGKSSDIAASEEQSADAVPEKEVVTQELTDPDKKASADELTGRWTDINDGTRFINITKDDDGFIYEDNEGKLKTAYRDGALEIKISGTETAKVYLDDVSGHLMLVYQDNASEYERK